MKGELRLLLGNEIKQRFERGRNSSRSGNCRWMGFCINRVKFVDVRVCTSSQRWVNGLDDGRSTDGIGRIQRAVARDVSCGFKLAEDETD